MTPKELAKKVRYIQIQTNRAVNDVLGVQFVIICGMGIHLIHGIQLLIKSNKEQLFLHLLHLQH